MLDLDFDILKMYLHTEDKVCRSKHLKVRTQAAHKDTVFAPVTLTIS